MPAHVRRTAEPQVGRSRGVSRFVEAPRIPRNCNYPFPLGLVVSREFCRDSRILTSHLRVPSGRLGERVLFRQVSGFPLDRQEVSSRICEQINYLLMDRRAGLMEWFDRMALHAPPCGRSFPTRRSRLT